MMKNIHDNTKKIRITTTLSKDFFELAKNKGIRLSDALARGIKVLVQGDSYEHEIDILKGKVSKLVEKLSDESRQREELENELSKTKAKVRTQEIDVNLIKDKLEEAK